MAQLKTWLETTDLIMQDEEAMEWRCSLQHSAFYGGLLPLLFLLLSGVSHEKTGSLSRCSRMYCECECIPVRSLVSPKKNVAFLIMAETGMLHDDVVCSLERRLRFAQDYFVLYVAYTKKSKISVCIGP